jgi:hypothetical protein
MSVKGMYFTLTLADGSNELMLSADLMSTSVFEKEKPHTVAWTIYDPKTI